MRNLLLLLFLSSFGTFAIAQNTKSFSLDEAIRYATQNSLEVKNSQIDIADAEQQIEENRAFGLPTVSANLGYNYYFKLPISLVPAEFIGGPPGEFAELAFGTKNNISAGIEARSLIFDWSYLTALKAARSYRDFAQQQRTQTEATVKNQIRTAYLPPLILEETKATLAKNIENIKKLRFETSEMYKAGFVEQLDVDRLDLTIANLETDLSNLDRQKELAYNVLKMAMNYPMNENIEATDNLNQLLTEASAEDLEGKINFTNRAEYQTALMSKGLNELNISYVKSTYYPNVAGFAQYTKNGQSDDFFNNNIWTDLGIIGLQASIPIYGGGAKNAKLQRAKLDLEKTNNQIAALERVIWMEVGNARIAYQSAKNRVASQEKNLELAQRIYDTTQIKYREGIGSSLEISSAEQSLFQSQQNLIQARYELLQAKVELDIALGK